MKKFLTFLLLCTFLTAPSLARAESDVELKRQDMIRHGKLKRQGKKQAEPEAKKKKQEKPKKPAKPVTPAYNP